MTKTFTITFLATFFTHFVFGQRAGKILTAQQIIQRAIDSSGGDKKFEQTRNVEMISRIVTAKNDTLFFATKRMGFNKYYISTLSLGYTNSTTIYNKGKAAITTGQKTQEILNPLKLEELKLQSYLSLDYGYKKLGYKLERQDDQKFQNFDCYVVLVSSPLGRATINYYDKKTGNLIMIIYPNGSKSVFIDFYKGNGITCPSKILMVDTLNQITASSLTKFNYDDNLDSNWFNIPTEGINSAPDNFKMGTFKYLNSNEGSTVIREKNTHTEIAGPSRTEYKIEWTTNNDYLIYRLKNPSAPPTNDNIEFIKVRIVSWTKNKYYCQYITSGNIGGTCAFEKVN